MTANPCRWLTILWCIFIGFSCTFQPPAWHAHYRPDESRWNKKMTTVYKLSSRMDGLNCHIFLANTHRLVSHYIKRPYGCRPAQACYRSWITSVILFTHWCDIYSLHVQIYSHFEQPAIRHQTVMQHRKFISRSEIRFVFTPEMTAAVTKFILTAVPVYLKNNALKQGTDQQSLLEWITFSSWIDMNASGVMRLRGRLFPNGPVIAEGVGILLLLLLRDWTDSKLDELSRRLVVNVSDL